MLLNAQYNNELKKNKIITVANGITLLRIICTLIMMQYIQRGLYINAYLFFTIAALTDFFDGFVARMCNEESTFGAYLDPVADKFLILASFFSLYENIANLIPMWFLFLLFAREVLLVFGGIILYFHDRRTAIIAPTVISKANTAISLFFIFTVFLFQFVPFVHCFFPFLVIINTVFTIVSSAQYTIIFIKKITN